MTRHGTAGGFDLARCDALRFCRLKTIRAKVQVRATFGKPFDPALMQFAEFCTLWLKQVYPSLATRRRTARCRTILKLLRFAITRLGVMFHDIPFVDPDFDSNDSIRR